MEGSLFYPTKTRLNLPVRNISRHCYLILVMLFAWVFIVPSLPAQEAERASITESENLREDQPSSGLAQTTQVPGRDWLYTALETNYIALNMVDLLTTYYSVDRGAREINPIARPFVEEKVLGVIFKAGLTAGSLYALRRIKKEDKKLAYLTLGGLNLLYGFVVRNNVGVVLSL